MQNLSTEQHKALDTNRHIAVNANAGSGKTTVLIQRFLSILEKIYDGSDEDIEVSQIIAITFTRKAAAEMKSGLINAIVEKIDNPQENDKVSVYEYKKLREKILYANITTIHSFCLNLLKEYPEEANIEPNIAEINKYEENQIIMRSITSVLDNWNKSNKDNLNILIDIFGIKRLNDDVILQMIRSKEKIENVKDLINNTDQILLKAELHITEIINNNIIESVSAISNFLSGIISSELIGKVSQNYDKAKTFLSNLTQSSDINVKINLISEIGKIRLGKKGINSMLFENGFNLKEKKELLESLAEIIQNEDSRKVIETSKILIDLFNDINNEINERKRRLNALDFDDMIEKTLKLLNNKNVIENLRNNIKYLMVDEFQDTNKAQYDIVVKLINGLNENPEKSTFAGKDYKNKKWANLFIVGDYKQSIYAFRSADVQVYKDMIKNISYSNTHGIKTKKIKTIETWNQDEQKGVIKFKASYRMQPNLAAFINDIFRLLMRKPNEIINDPSAEIFKIFEGFQVDYDDLVAAKNASNAIKALKTNNILGPDYGRIDILSTIIDENTGENEEDENEVRTEEQNIADYIINSMNNENYKVKGRRAVFSDFSILSRKAKKFNLLAAEFTKRKIPFIIHSGKGYYQKQEIIDYIAFIKFLINKNDDLNLLSALRSPFFRINDETILEIFKSKGSSLWSKFNSYAKDNTSDKIQRAIEIISYLDNLLFQVTIPELLYRIAENTGWYGVVESYYDADQRIANLEKLIDAARNFEERGFKNIIDFLNEINVFIDDDSESEASLSSTGDAVQIMTIHKSKGLGFNVVIVYDMFSKIINNATFLIDKFYGITYKISQFDNPKIQDENSVFWLSKKINKQAEIEEDKRLLYVAFTRAKEHLAISFDGNKVEGLGKMFLEAASIDTSQLIKSVEINRFSDLQLLENDKTTKAALHYIINVLHSDEQQHDSIIIQKNTTDDDLILNIEHIEPEISGEIYSATKLSKFDQQPNEYIDKYLFGLSFESDKFKDEREFEKDEEIIQGTKFGSIVHEVMEKINLWYDPKSGLNETKLLKTVRRKLDENNIETSQNNSSLFHDEITGIIDNELIRDNINLILKSDKEIDLMLPFEGEMLYAQIDLLFKNSENEYEVWDWKTNSLENSTIEKIAQKYITQMKFYCYFLMKRYPNQNEYKSKLLFTKAAKNNNWTYTQVWSKDDLIKFEKELKVKLNKIKEFDFDYIL